jgi:hypothetical protein
VLGVSKGRAAELILLSCPLLLQLWCNERFAIGRLVMPLYVYEAPPEGHARATVSPWARCGAFGR